MYSRIIEEGLGAAAQSKAVSGRWEAAPATASSSSLLDRQIPTLLECLCFLTLRLSYPRVLGVLSPLQTCVWWHSRFANRYQGSVPRHASLDLSLAELNSTLGILQIYSLLHDSSTCIALILWKKVGFRQISVFLPVPDSCSEMWRHGQLSFGRLTHVGIYSQQHEVAFYFRALVSVSCLVVLACC